MLENRVTQSVQQAVIFCGGRGERLRPLTDHLPKPLAPVLGRPFLEYLIEQLREEGITRVLLLTGYRGAQVAAHFAAHPVAGVEISYSEGPAEWETGRRLAEARAMLDERFVLLYADNLAPFRLAPLWQHHCEIKAQLTVTLAAKEKGNIRLGADGKVDAYDSSRTQPGLRHVEIGYMIAERDAIFALSPERGSFSLVIEQLARARQLGAFNPGHRYYCSTSDLKRLREAEEFLTPRKIILLDRDGVLNQRAPRGEYVARPEEFKWVPETLEGLDMLARAGFEFIVLSNQAGIGRGVVTAEAVNHLHAWMIGQLAKRGVKVREVLLCPHHWIEPCICRKPKPGMFLEASAKYRFSLHYTPYVGDDARDAVAAWNACCPCVLLGAIRPEPSVPVIPPHFHAENLPQAVGWLREHYRRMENALSAEVPS